ncbi:MAG: hypothetical protein K5798_03855 [Nitrosopumilus sp.]|uniref:hypothetical protein n=1 Tax=Nitrosopumilus sp. TaxID=2024843 RepID=UPI00242C1476|nr:hypothetical protein [Nitrosopumilus sp.]MCV0366387.1 hypothetical protein [Nitrosopumilus sp.]
MTGKRLTGKFSEEEYALIKQLQEKENINDNQLVRGGVTLLVQFALVKDFMKNSDFGKMIKPFVKDMDKYVKSPQIQKKLERSASKMSKKKIEKIETEAKLIEKNSKIFTKKRKVGRPKKKKIPNKRGRPKV